MALEWLIPKEKEFYKYFEEMANMCVTASNKLNENLKNYSPEKRETFAKEMKDIEHNADKVAEKIYKKTATSFMTPLDTERIVGLTKALDGVIDKIDKFTSMCNVYEVSRIDNFMLEFGNLLKDTALIVQQDVLYLKDAEKKKGEIIKLNEEIREKERQGDMIHKSAMKELFKSKDAVYIIKMRDIYDTLEDATDECRDVANEISDIITKLA